MKGVGLGQILEGIPEEGNIATRFVALARVFLCAVSLASETRWR